MVQHCLTRARTKICFSAWKNDGMPMLRACDRMTASPHQTSRSLYTQYISSCSMALSSATGLRPVMRRTSRHMCA